jgi:hypothetical protein
VTYTTPPHTSSGAHARAVGGDQVDGQQVVAGQAELPVEPAVPSSQGEAGDAGGRHPATGGHQTVGLGGPVEVAHGGAARDRRDPSLGIDGHRVHEAKVDDEATVADGLPGHAVASTPDGDLEPALAREADGAGHVVDGLALGDDCRTPVDHGVEDHPGLVVVPVAGQDQVAGEAVTKRRAVEFGHRHSSPFPSSECVSPRRSPPRPAQRRSSTSR